MTQERFAYPTQDPAPVSPPAAAPRSGERAGSPNQSLEDALLAHEARVDALLKQAERQVRALKAWRKTCRAGHAANRELEFPQLAAALQQHDEEVDALLKQASKYVGALKNWKKACQNGHLADRQKGASLAVEHAGDLAAPTAEAAAAWTFEPRAYLESDRWRAELRSVAAERFGLRILEEGDTLISSPVIVRAQPGRGVLLLGKKSWPRLRPRAVAEELKRLRERPAAAGSRTCTGSTSSSSPSPAPWTGTAGRRSRPARSSRNWASTWPTNGA